MTTLPNKSFPNGFLLLAFDRQCAFMVAELIAIREAVLGSDALIAKAKAIPRLSLDNILANILAPHGSEFSYAILKLTHLVNRVAWGDACLRWAGHLPPVEALVPRRLVGLCTMRECICQGMLPNQDVSALFKATSKPDWQRFLDFAEQERASGRLSAPSAATLRSRLVRALENTHEVFLKMVAGGIEDACFPHRDFRMIMQEFDFRHLLDKVEPLPADLLHGLEDGDPATYSLDQLDALRARGTEMRDSCIRMRRKEGNVLHERSLKASGSEAEDFLDRARTKWFSVNRLEGVEALTAQCNLAAVALQNKRYALAFEYATACMTASQNAFKEPKSHRTFRSSFATAFGLGQLPELTAETRRVLSDDETKAYINIQWKASCRMLKAQIGLTHEDLAGSGAISAEKKISARRNYDSAVKMFKFVQTASFPLPAGLGPEMEKLEKAFRKRMHSQ